MSSKRRKRERYSDDEDEPLPSSQHRKRAIGVMEGRVSRLASEVSDIQAAIEDMRKLHKQLKSQGDALAAQVRAREAGRAHRLGLSGLTSGACPDAESYRRGGQPAAAATAAEYSTRIDGPPPAATTRCLPTSSSFHASDSRSTATTTPLATAPSIPSSGVVVPTAAAPAAGKSTSSPGRQASGGSNQGRQRHVIHGTDLWTNLIVADLPDDAPHSAGPLDASAGSLVTHGSVTLDPQASVSPQQAMPSAGPSMAQLTAAAMHCASCAAAPAAAAELDGPSPAAAVPSACAPWPSDLEGCFASDLDEDILDTAPDPAVLSPHFSVFGTEPAPSGPPPPASQLQGANGAGASCSAASPTDPGSISDAQQSHFDAWRCVSGAARTSELAQGHDGGLSDLWTGSAGADANAPEGSSAASTPVKGLAGASRMDFSSASGGAGAAITGAAAAAHVPAAVGAATVVHAAKGWPAPAPQPSAHYQAQYDVAWMHPYLPPLLLEEETYEPIVMCAEPPGHANLWHTAGWGHSPPPPQQQPFAADASWAYAPRTATAAAMPAIVPAAPAGYTQPPPPALA